MGAGDFQAAHAFQDVGDFAGGDALDVHFGQSELEGAFAAKAFLQGGGVEIDVTAHLRHLKGKRAQAGGDGLGFKAVGIAQTLLGALVRSCLEGIVALGFHGFVDEQPEALGERVLLGIQKELQNGFDNVSLSLVGRVFVHVCCE